MSVQISQGTQVAIASAYGVSKNMTALSNATEAVATLEASHGIIVGDIFEVTSGWGRLNRRIVRAKTVATNDVTMESIDTSSTTLYPAGSGTGTIREVTAFTSVTQVKDFNAETPSVDFIDSTFLEDLVKTEIPGLESAPKITATVAYDLALSWLSTAYVASDTNALTALRLVTSGGNKIYGNAYWKLSRFPAPTIGDLIKLSLNITLAALATAYTS